MERERRCPDLELTTQRLRILPMDQPLFALYLESIPQLEQQLNLHPCGEILDPATKAAMEWLYGKMQEQPSHWLWYSCWLIIQAAENRIIGSCCFKGPPDEQGQVEIGYGIHPSHRGKGYMTEAAKALYRWALAQPDVKAVTAETDRDNPASHGVLEKSGMTRAGATGNTIYWIIREESH